MFPKNHCLLLAIGLGLLLPLTAMADPVEINPEASQTLETQTLESPITPTNDSSADDQTLAPVELEPPTRRGLPAPIDSPPFPSGEWQIGGTPGIGVPDTSDTYTLMKLLNKTPLANALQKSRIKIYGWVDVGGNLSTSRKSNAPAAYSIYPNRIDLNQVLFRIERLPDTVQQDHVDWGFHLSNVYGLDYRFTTANGIFSDQLLKKNRRYGYDPILAYADVYIPKVADGMTLRIGRFLSIPDIEAQLAPDNYMYTHSLMYTYDVFTQQGILATIKLNSQWSVQGGLTVGNDTAIWTRAAEPTGLAAVQWISKSNNDSIYLVANSLNSGKYSYNNLQEFVGTWSHRFNKRIHTKTQAWYMYQHHVPADKLPSNVKPGFTNEWALLNYFEIKLSDKSYVSIRNEIMDDRQGQRTGTATVYTSHGIGLTYWLNKFVALRPELRFERSYDAPAYDNGRRQNQFMFAMDMIYRY